MNLTPLTRCWKGEVQGTKNVTRVTRTDDKLTRMKLEGQHKNIHQTKFTYEGKNKSMQNLKNGIDIQNKKKHRKNK